MPQQLLEGDEGVRQNLKLLGLHEVKELQDVVRFEQKNDPDQRFVAGTCPQHQATVGNHLRLPTLITAPLKDTD